MAVSVVVRSVTLLDLENETSTFPLYVYTLHILHCKKYGTCISFGCQEVRHFACL